MTLLAILSLGFFLGVRHATDSDHVVAVTALVSRGRSLRSALRVGALWGLGHTATILCVGGAIALFGWVIPPELGLSMELSVAVMLIVLGAMNVSGAFSRLQHAAHAHGGAARHTHAAPERALGRLRPLTVGAVHGMAGSAAIALLLLATLPHASQAPLYLLVFGAGTIAGMMLLTAVMSLPLSLLARRFSNVEQPLARLTGLVSIAFGLFLAYRIGVVDGLLFGTPNWDPH